MAEFQVPAFLDNHSTEEVFATMASVLPPDIDLSQGGNAYNMTMPTALVVAQICEFVLPEVIQLIFPSFSYGEWLDYHAETRGMTRRAATAATGSITITGTAGTIIPVGSVFSTTSINNNPSVDYATTEAATIPSGGTVDVTVECTQTGTIGNTSANTVIIAASTITGLTSVTNTGDITGGTAEESDEDLIQRIAEYDQSQGSSFVGNVADYIRWAKSVDGVGSVSVTPAQDTSGLVTIVLTDINGAPATEQLCEEVYNYIMSPDDPESRLAPVNALLSVTAPDTISIMVQATVELTAGATTISDVTAAYVAQVATYLATAIEEGEVKYTKMASILSSVDGVNDFSGFQIGAQPETRSVVYGTSNIAIGASELPLITIEDVTFTEGTVDASTYETESE